jgi:RNA polymerase sigma factor (TIGR02999 family)
MISDPKLNQSPGPPTTHPNSTDALCQTVYQELRHIAAWHLSATHESITLDATDLVHEAISRVLKQRRVEWNERAHLLAVASIMIRRVLVNHIRNRSAAIRGGGHIRQSLLTDPACRQGLTEHELLVLHEALQRLEQINERQTRIVEMKYFGGLSTEDIATYLGISQRTVQLDWIHAKLWLTRELADE